MSPLGILLIGAETQVGRSILNFDFLGLFEVVAPGPDLLCITDPANLMSTIKNGFRGSPWFAVINCANYVSLDSREGDEVMAWLVNAVCPAAIGEACARSGALLVQLFVNSVSIDVIENDGDGSVTLKPLQRYDESKAGGEGALRQSGARYIAIRADRVIGNQRGDLIFKIIEILSRFNNVVVPQDNFGEIITAHAVARAMCLICIESSSSFKLEGKMIDISETNNIGWSEFMHEIAISLRRSKYRCALINASKDSAKCITNIATIVRNGFDIHDFLNVAKDPWQDSIDLIVREVLTSRPLARMI